MRPEAELAVEWLRKGDDDLAASRLMLTASEPIPWIAAFHAEQAAEKFLKAFLTFHRVEFARTHDIGYLLGLCVELAPQLAALSDAAPDLTDFAVEARYPFPRKDPPLDEARRALQIARDLAEAVREQLPDEICRFPDGRSKLP
ncbi:MAG: HEPN domain-containing protein [Planctomycetota bacterium]